jgi:aurora kinase
MYLILHYASNGELFKFISRSNGFIKENICKTYVQDIASAVKYMHDRFIFHRDIKPENILIADNGRLLLADFGSAVNSPPLQLQSSFKTGLSK